MEAVTVGATAITPIHIVDAVTKQSPGTIDGLVRDLSLEVNNEAQAKFSSKLE